MASGTNPLKFTFNGTLGNPNNITAAPSIEGAYSDSAGNSTWKGASKVFVVGYSLKVWYDNQQGIDGPTTTMVNENLAPRIMIYQPKQIQDMDYHDNTIHPFPGPNRRDDFPVNNRDFKFLGKPKYFTSSNKYTPVQEAPLLNTTGAGAQSQAVTYRSMPQNMRQRFTWKKYFPVGKTFGTSDGLPDLTLNGTEFHKHNRCWVPPAVLFDVDPSKSIYLDRTSVQPHHRIHCRWTQYISADFDQTP